MKFLTKSICIIWRAIRTVSGDDAYERYLLHWNKFHVTENNQPLDRKAFFKAEQSRKWDGIRRCC